MCSGGELHDRISDAGHLTEVQAAISMEQIVRALHYMHANHVTHHDLKPANFVFMTKDPIENNLLKIIDFGLSCSFSAGQVLKTKCGTPYYMAPQVLACKYDQISDMWSMGVIMYVMLCGYPPFVGETDADVLTKVRLGNFSFKASDWKNISEDAKNLICNLLKMNPRNRYTAEQTLNHEWIKSKAPQSKQLTLPANLVDELRGSCSHNKLKKAALAIIAQQLNEEKITQLRDTFMLLDANGDGKISKEELNDVLQSGDDNVAARSIVDLLAEVDQNSDGEIDFDEFMHMMRGSTH